MHVHARIALDDDGVGQNSVCNDGYLGVNDGFYECDAIARTEALVNTMAMVKTYDDAGEDNAGWRW